MCGAPIPTHASVCERARTQTQTHTYTHTHLLRNIFANSAVECIVRAKNTPVKPDRRHWVLGDQEWETMRRKSFNVLAKRVNLFWCSSFKQGQIVVFLTARWFLGYPRPISEIWHENGSRHVKGTSPFDITVTSGRLRWHRNQSHTCAPCWVLEVLHLFRCYTHTPSCRTVEKLRSGQWNENEGEGKWKWGESENEMKVTYPGREEGNAKEEGRRKHQHMKPSPKRANPGKAREKKKRRPTDTKQGQRRGEDGRLNQPTTAKPTPTSARAEHNLPEERRTQEHMR